MIKTNKLLAMCRNKIMAGTFKNLGNTEHGTPMLVLLYFCLQLCDVGKTVSGLLPVI